MDTKGSVLGTLQYWDGAYAQELANLEDFGEEGEVWFGRGCERRMLDWVCAHVGRERSILDVGCGNGHFLCGLFARGYERLVGVDYSAKAVGLARRVAERRGQLAIGFEVGDVLGASAGGRYDLVCDKGTFDAVCLRPGADRQDLVAAYKAFVLGSLWDGGLFLITSCNWTLAELEAAFAPELSLLEALPAPATFAFGGSLGSTVTSAVFCV